MSTRLKLFGATALGCALALPALTTGALAQPAPAATPVAAAAPAAAPSNFFSRFYQAYVDELTPSEPDPNAPAIRRPPPFPPQPENAPPYPFTEWPFGGGSPIGATVPAMVESPLMHALKPTSFGTWLDDNGIQIYGWINPGMNFSTSGNRKGGNWPAAYAYDPNTLWLDQAVVIFERTPDTVQQDHFDWGFRVSPIYGETYRYTTGLGYASYQLQKKNYQDGFDAPMVYGELYIPMILEGALLRVGRYISVPDTEAQLAPNNYMYSHSMTYAYDNYTNTGALLSVQVTKNLLLQGGITVGTDAAPWLHGSPQYGYTVPGAGYTVGYQNGLKDPGVQPSYTACIRWTSDSSNDTVYGCGNGLNNGTFGYNNLQQYAATYYHKFNDQWHLTYEVWDMHENNVPNGNYTGPKQAVYPFGTLLNGPFAAQCGAARSVCRAEEYAMVSYLNYLITPDDNISLRLEFFNDQNGQRTGVKTRYLNPAIGLQHWFTPTIQVRPELAMYNSLDKPAFNGSPAGGAVKPPNSRQQLVFSMDLIWHY